MDNRNAISIKVYEELFLVHYTDLARTAYRLVSDTNAAEDIVQDVFCKLWEIKDRLQITTSLKSYLFQMVINNSLNYHKKNQALQMRETVYGAHADNSANTTTDQLDVKETRKRLEQAINALPPTCRLVFILSRHEQLTYKEIAAHLGISVKAVENHMIKALKQLRSIVGLFVLIQIIFLGR